jgi:hypothetical protein
MPAAIYGPYEFLNFNGKLFSRKQEMPFIFAIRPRPVHKRLWELYIVVT